MGSTELTNECQVATSREKSYLQCYKGKIFYYNGTTWKQTQDKIKVNQQPLFENYRGRAGLQWAHGTKKQSSSAGRPHIKVHKNVYECI